MTVAALAIRRANVASRCAEGLVLGIFMGILFAIVNLFLESLCLFLVCKRQPCKTLLEFKGVEKDSVLVVGECVVYLLVPDDTSTSRLLSLVQDNILVIYQAPTEMSTIFSQKVLPTRSLASTTAPCKPVYVHRCLSG